MEFLTVDSVETARGKLYSHASDWLTQCESIPFYSALGRILAEDIFVREDIPGFRRSTVDGYAVICGDTAAASESMPVFLTEKGRVDMGQPALFSIVSGECAEVPTGGMIPDGADAVVMVEYTEPFGTEGIALGSAVSYGENIVQIGEDVRADSILLHQGRRILPQDIGALAAAGITTVPVYARPSLTILSTGDELISANNTPKPGMIRDINTHALAALAEKNGFSVAGTNVLPDDENIIEQAIRQSMAISDIIAISGGSSQGKKDMTRAVIDKVSFPGVFTHGLAIKPGKPTILGCDNSTRTLLIGLPGHPVSAMMVFELLLSWLIREITNSPEPPAIPARVSCNIASSPGKLTCWPTRLRWTECGYEAEPIFGKSGLITTLTKADGFFIVDRGTEGLKAGQTILVHLF